MKMPLDIPMGVTFERTQHSEIAVEIRTLTKGGMIQAYGNRDLDHCLLDYLFRRGMLGNEQDAQERYNMGYRLRDLWFSFNSTGTPLEQMGQGKKEFVSEGEIGTGEDYQRAMFNAIMKALPNKYRPHVLSVCIDDIWIPEQYVRESLDALFGAFFRFDSQRKEFDKKIIQEI